jgi:adenine-specific DNA-methyltransferase
VPTERILEIEAASTDELAQKYSLETFSLGNRRYLGSKTKLLRDIEIKLNNILGRKPKSLMDAFAGSGVVAAHFADLGSKVITNDLLLHNTMAHRAFLLHSEYSMDDAARNIVKMAGLKPRDGYITKTFGGKYFSIENARKLDAAREYIEKELDSEALQAAAITSLIYAADKVAQTVGHYDAFFNRDAIDKPVVFKLPKVIGKGTGHRVLTQDANKVVGKQKVEVLYLDPPYNSRQYSDAYHVLENIARWEKPEVFGVSQKMDRTSMKSKYSTRSAAFAFEDLIQSAKAEFIVLSYSNTGTSRAARSNNVLTDAEILDSMSKVGQVHIENIEFKEFSVGRTSKREHKERLFVCEVGGK